MPQALAVILDWTKGLEMTGARTLSVSILLLVATGCGSDQGSDGSAVSAGGEAADCPTEGAEFADAKIFIEHNATDEDTGVHALFAADGWTELCVTDPNGQRLAVVRPEGQLGDLGVADLFWESREPANDEYSIEDLEADFPEGEYRVSGIDLEGNPMVGTAEFTHAIPAAPTITAPSPLAEDAETAVDATHPPDGFEVSWEPVTETIDGEPLDVTGYEVIITDEAFEDANGFSKPVYDVHVRPETTSLTVPLEFFTPGTVYELEVLALEASGNQTISLGFFATP
jgi:hypothetical protein